MINQLFHRFGKGNAKSSRRNGGQVAVVLIFIIAIALIMYSASLNWAKVAQYKALVTIASNTAASGMASFIASYGENRAQTQLGGLREVCMKSMLLNLILLILVIVVGSMLVLSLGGAIINSGMSFFVALLISVAIPWTLQTFVVDPGLTRLWNKMQSNLPLSGQVIEGAIQEGLTTAATDTEVISDHFDYDVDGLWVDQRGLSNSNERTDKIGRLTFYYTKRLLSYATPKYPEIAAFQGGLSEFLYDNPFAKADKDRDFFGLFDPGCTSTTPGSTPNPYCDSCCVPATYNGKVLRPASCTAAQVAACGSGDYPVTSYQWQYDPVYENYANSFYSFREQLGIDDENAQFVRNSTDPNPPPPQTTAISQGILGVFRKEDSTGFYPADQRKGIFPFFWQMSKWPPAVATNVAGIRVLPRTDTVVMMTANPATCTLTSCPNTFVAQPNQCAISVGTDPVTNLPRTNGFWWKPGADQYCSNVYPYDDCISFVGNCANQYVGGNPPNCGCIASNDPTLWHDDNVDNLVYGLKQFLVFSLNFLKTDPEDLGKDFNSWYPDLAMWIAPKCTGAQKDWCYSGPTDGTLIVWRNMVGAWLDLFDTWLYKTAFVDNNSWCMPTLATARNTFTYKELSSMPSQGEYASRSTNNLTIARTGTINLKIAANLSYVPDQSVSITSTANTANYMVGTVVSYNSVAGDLSVKLNYSHGSGSFASWNVSNAAKDRNGANIPAIWGDTEDVIACLNYNLDNVAKLTACKTHCTQQPTAFTCNAKYCLNLPRSVVDLRNSSANAAENTAYQTAQRLQDCLTSRCKTSTGATLSVCQGLPGVTQAPNCTNFSPGNPFYDAIRIERDRQFDLSNYCEPTTAPTTKFQDNIDAAITAGEAQEPIFNDRVVDLTDLRNGALSARSALLGFYDNLNKFLAPCRPGVPLGVGCEDCSAGGPAANIICARQRSLLDNGLPNFVIYGWKSKPVAGRGALGTAPEEGYWHLVRVEAFAPQRCWNRCGTDTLPFVKTRVFWQTITKVRCYTLVETDGQTISRVTRWDEDHDSPGARLANGQLLWKFRFGQPGMSPVTIGNTLNVDCKHPKAFDTGLSPESIAVINNGFMINRNPIDDPTVRPTCYNLVQSLLDRGVQTTTCARYYYDDAINHMNLKFTKCNDANVDYLTNCAQAANGTCS